MTKNLFEYAVRNKLRFPSVKGPSSLTAEDLWDVPLRSKDDFNLNAIAKTVSRAWKDASEENFVETTKTPAHTRLEMALETVKYVIETKLAEEEAAKVRLANKAEADQLIAILADKEKNALSDLTVKDLRKRIAALRSES